MKTIANFTKMAYRCIEISMSAPNPYLVELHGWPRAVTNVRIGNKFVYVGPVDGHVLYSSDEEPCPPGTILTVTNTRRVWPRAGASGASRLCYQLSAGTYDHELECRSFERWMYADALAHMINRRQLRKVPEVSHQEALGRRGFRLSWRSCTGSPAPCVQVDYGTTRTSRPFSSLHWAQTYKPIRLA